MADHPETPEAVALELLKIVTRAEGSPLDTLTETTKPSRAGNHSVRDYILDVYSECLKAASGRRQVVPADGNA